MLLHAGCLPRLLFARSLTLSLILFTISPTHSDHSKRI